MKSWDMKLEDAARKFRNSAAFVVALLLLFPSMFGAALKVGARVAWEAANEE